MVSQSSTRAPWVWNSTGRCQRQEGKKLTCPDFLKYLVSKFYFHIYAATMKIHHPDRNNYLATFLFVCLFQSWTCKPVITGFSKGTRPKVCVASCVAVYVCIHMKDMIDTRVNMSFVYESHIVNRGPLKWASSSNRKIVLFSQGCHVSSSPSL